MEQILILGRPLDQYRAIINGKRIYFESLPIPYKFLDMKQNWDDKITLKKELTKHGIPVPQSLQLPFLNLKSLAKVFSKLPKPVIVKPKIGSRGRHTVTNINTLEQFIAGVKIVKKISVSISVEEHLDGYVCRATVVDGKLAGFFRTCAPYVVGDGVKTVKELIDERDANRNPRVQPVNTSVEMHNQISRAGFSIDDVLPSGVKISLSHRAGRLFGGTTREMIDELHPSFVPILEKAGKVVGLAVAGFDCIIPDPTQDQASQKWGIIECNTLPFIDLHYYALEGKPRNIAGMIWDMWN
jgi:D-alanine-D-alanine ligase-like ATP-grasp enzyme